MDADLQNDPEDIPRLLAKLEEGYDVVSGWRRDRQDPLWSRRIPSMIANGLISRWTGVELNDYGCTLKAYRATSLKGEQLYGEMHRFFLALASMTGARVAEIPVNYKVYLKDGSWLVYDVIIEGVSLISNYRSSYQEIVKKDGFDGLLAKIEEKIRELRSEPAEAG